MSITAKQIPCTSPNEVRLVAVDFQGKLDSGELLTGTPVVTEVSTSDLTLANKAISTGALTIDGITVAIAEAVQFSVTGGTVANSPYTIKVSIGTDSTPAQTLLALLKLAVVAES